MGHRSLNNTLTLQLWHGSPGQQRHSVWLISRPPVTSELFVGRRLDFLFHSLLYTLCLCWIFGPDVRYLLCSADPSFLLESETVPWLCAMPTSLLESLTSLILSKCPAPWALTLISSSISTEYPRENTNSMVCRDPFSGLALWLGLMDPRRPCTPLPQGPQSPPPSTETEGELSPLAEDPPRVKFKVERRRVGPTTLGRFGGAGGLVTQLCLSLAPWTVARQAPLPMGFSRQEYWSGLPFPSPEDLPDPNLCEA